MSFHWCVKHPHIEPTLVAEFPGFKLSSLKLFAV